jgi:hypothetical protein
MRWVVLLVMRFFLLKIWLFPERLEFTSIYLDITSATLFFESCFNNVEPPSCKTVKFKPS